MEFSDFEQGVLKGIAECKGRVKHCCENAILHLEKAWIIRELDKEMAIFRGITAEEEAATGLFLCLKQHGYNNSDKINFKNHQHKLGLYPFLRHVGNHLSGSLFTDGSPFHNFRLANITIGNRRAVEIVFSLRGTDLEARPRPPLHMSISKGRGGELVAFNRDFMELSLSDCYPNAKKYIESVANTRNLLLYAANQGKPVVSGDIEENLKSQKLKVIALLVIVLLIDPWEKEEGQSSFIQQVLDSFLMLLNKIHEEDAVHSKQLNSFPLDQ